MGEPLQWEIPADAPGTIEVAVDEVTLIDRGVPGGAPRKATVAFRVIHESRGWRADVKTWYLGPWEAIDDGAPFGTRREAKKHAELWLTRANEEGRLSPRMERRWKP